LRRRRQAHPLESNASTRTWPLTYKTAFLHHGQLCFSTERIIVLEKVAPEFTELFKKAAENFPTTPGVALHIVNQARDKLIDAESKGAKFLTGGPAAADTHTMSATVITGVTRDMRIFDEEGFCPSVALFVAKDDKEAIEIANDTRYGMNAAIFSTNMQRAISVGRRIDCAQIHVNNMTVHDEPTLPLGGSKNSGWGRTNAMWGLGEFLMTRLITVPLEGKLEFI
jgi:acyl-CoA reductase-like NAD-dependent aldehyde dehydrogenase